MVPADHVGDVQDSPVPAQRGVHVGEEQPGATEGEPPGAVGHVGLQQQPHPRPLRPHRDLPVAPQEFAEGVAQSADGRVPGAVEGGAQGLGRRVGEVGVQQVAPDHRGGGAADDGQLLLERRGEAFRTRGEEVRHRTPLGHQGEQQPRVETV